MPELQSGLGAQGECAVKRLMLGAEANLLNGEQEGGQAIRYMWRSGLENAIEDVSVDREREVRAVLLGGSHGQNGHGTLCVERCKVGGAQVAPQAPVWAELGW